MATSQLPDRVACYRHSDHLTGVHCTRCGRPICPDCMAPAPVGHHCPTCVHEDSKGGAGARRVRRPGGAAGTRAVGGTRAAAGRRLTPVVATLVALNVVAFILTSSHPLWKFDYAQLPVLVAHGQAYRLLTATFIHENLTHILFNMAALVIMGPTIEEALGRNRFLALYLLAGLGGSVLSFLFGPVHVFGLGASGAIFGIFGAWFSLARAQRADTGVIVFLIALNLAYSFWDPAIDWRAHVGGLVTGLALGALFAWAARRPARFRVAYEAAALLGTLALFAAAGGGPLRPAVRRPVYLVRRRSTMPACRSVRTVRPFRSLAVVTSAACALVLGVFGLAGVATAAPPRPSATVVNGPTCTIASPETITGATFVNNQFVNGTWHYADRGRVHQRHRRHRPVRGAGPQRHQGRLQAEGLHRDGPDPRRHHLQRRLLGLQRHLAVQVGPDHEGPHWVHLHHADHRVRAGAERPVPGLRTDQDGHPLTGNQVIRWAVWVSNPAMSRIKSPPLYRMS